MQALEKARAEGKKAKTTTTTTNAESRSDAVNGEKQDGSFDSGASRKEKLEAAKAKAKAMKVGELKKALQDIGISTKSFFEKSEFVNAYAEAMVDGKKQTARAGKRQTPQQDEPHDPSYRDVTMRKVDRRELLLGPGVIDVTLKR